MKNDEQQKIRYEDLENSDYFKERFGEEVGRGMQSVVYAKGDVAVKVYRKGYSKSLAYYEAYVMSIVEQLGLPTTKLYGIEEIGGHFALKMERAKGVSLAGEFLDPARTSEALDVLVKLQIQFHTTEVHELLPLKLILESGINTNTRTTEEEKQRLRTILAGLPEGNNLCHGDFHFGNILHDGDTYTIVDLLEVARGCPLGDAARTYIDLFMFDAALAESYLGKYCTEAGASRGEVEQWLPVIAGVLLGHVTEEFTDMMIHFIRGK